MIGGMVLMSAAAWILYKNKMQGGAGKIIVTIDFFQWLLATKEK